MDAIDKLTRQLADAERKVTEARAMRDLCEQQGRMAAAARHNADLVAATRKLTELRLQVRDVLRTR